MSVADRIRSFRADRKWSQARLGQELGVTRFTVMRWESGTQPDQKLLPAISRVTGIPAKEVRPDLAKLVNEETQ